MKILAVIVGADSTATCLNAAVLGAQCVGECTIEALNVVVDPAHLVAASDEVDMQRLRERWEGTASERSAACHPATRLSSRGTQERRRTFRPSPGGPWLAMKKPW